MWLLGGGFGSVGGCEAVLFLCVGKNVSPVGLLGGGDCYMLPTLIPLMMSHKQSRGKEFEQSRSGKTSNSPNAPFHL